jgi:ABC-type branched-subunit amino acid transport system ATPase component
MTGLAGHLPDPSGTGGDVVAPRPPAVERTPILTVAGVSKRFGGVQALAGVDLAVQAGRITGLIGPNGSGKSTLFDVITGITRADAGAVRFRGVEVTQLPPDRIYRLGIARTFQLTRLFGRLTAFENLIVVARDDPIAHRRADDLLDFFTLRLVRNEYAGNLSYGQQKLLEFARLLMNDPALFLLDEPFAGVNPVLERRLLGQLAEWRRAGKTVLVTDHEMPIIMGVCDELFVLDHGAVIAHGTPEQVRADPRVMEAYFGR